MGGFCSHMIGLAIVDVPEQQRHPTFALAALGGAVSCVAQGQDLSLPVPGLK